MLNSITEQWLQQRRKQAIEAGQTPDSKALAAELSGPPLSSLLAADLTLRDGALPPHLVKNGLRARFAAFEAADATAMLQQAQQIPDPLPDPVPPEIQGAIDGIRQLQQAIGDLDFMCQTMLFVGTNTVPEDAAKMAELFGALEQFGVITPEQVAGIQNLAGGLLYSQPDAGEVTAYFAQIDLDESRADLVNRSVAAHTAALALINTSDPVPDTAAVVAAFKEALG